MIAGIDEAGRGCWAGPLVAAAVVLQSPIRGLNDSKQLSAKKRDTLALEIKKSAIIGIGWVAAREVDELGLTAATFHAMKTAIEMLPDNFTEVIIDGNYNYLAEFSRVKTVKTLVKADQLIPEVSAASIIAKTERDAYMHRIAADYPAYQFERHVGYGTALHHQLLREHGPCEEHRLSYKPLQAILRVGRV